MIRAFSVGPAVATIRPIIGMFFATSRFSGLTPYEFFGIGFWTCFVLHLIAAQAWTHATLPSKTTGGVFEPLGGFRAPTCFMPSLVITRERGSAVFVPAS